MSDKIRSMTGMGTSSVEIDGFEISIKAQSVNSRYLDISFRLPSVYSEFENELRSVVREYVSRGKVDLYFDIKDLRDDSVVPVLNTGIVNAYIQAIESLPRLEEINRQVTAADILQFSHALRMESKELEDADAFIAGLSSALQSAMKELVENRRLEGKRMMEDISGRLTICGKNIDSIESRVGEIKAEYMQKMRDRIAELLQHDNLDEGRLEQEAAHMLDRADITEELVRFRSHLKRFDEIANEGGEAGKKLDFLMQEFNREINTIGSKSKNLEISRLVVDIKSELEKIREQVQNIE